jgi:hypothetical protein
MSVLFMIGKWKTKRWGPLYWHFSFPWLYSPWRTLAASHIGGFLNYIIRMVGLLGRVISPSQGLYLHRTTQHRKTRDKHPCLERDSNPRSPQSTGQDPRLRPHGHCDRFYIDIMFILIFVKIRPLVQNSLDGTETWVWFLKHFSLFTRTVQ